MHPPEQGGATRFDLLNLAVQPEKGKALLFFPAFADGTADARCGRLGWRTGVGGVEGGGVAEHGAWGCPGRYRGPGQAAPQGSSPGTPGWGLRPPGPWAPRARPSPRHHCRPLSSNLWLRTPASLHLAPALP